jgi:hypothetical protein|tara:strand:- start:210 stop:437 length:228 start_codon:yes stop_codon:yes gene_type:complete
MLILNTPKWPQEKPSDKGYSFYGFFLMGYLQEYRYANVTGISKTTIRYDKKRSDFYRNLLYIILNLLRPRNADDS